MISNERLKEMREVVGAVPKERWEVSPNGGVRTVETVRDLDDGEDYYIQICTMPRVPRADADSEFIAHFNPETVRELLDEIDRYREALEMCKDRDSGIIFTIADKALWGEG